MKYKLIVVGALLLFFIVILLYKKPLKETNKAGTLQVSTQTNLNGWIPTKLKDSEGDCSVSLTKEGALKAKFSQAMLPTITLGLKSPYSTADVICANQYCEEFKKLPLTLSGTIVNVPVIVASVEINNEKQFDYYSFSAKVSDYLIPSPNYTEKVPLGVYAVYANAEQEKDIIDFISTASNAVSLYKRICID